jgi:hypothetical protein
LVGPGDDAMPDLFGVLDCHEGDALVAGEGLATFDDRLENGDPLLR